MNPQIQYAKTDDGVNIAYYAIGSGPPLIWMSPGVITNIEDEWDIPALQQQLRATARGFTVVRYDLRGCGLSDRDVVDLSLEAMTRDLEAVVKRVAPGTCAVMGPGSGALTAVAYAAAHPEDVSHLVLWAPNGGEEIESLDRLLELADTDWRLASDSYASAVDDWSSPEDARRWAAMMRQGVSPETFLRYESERAKWGVDELAPRVEARTLIVHPRDHPYFAPEFARRLASAIPGARLVLPEGSTVFMPSRKGLETMAEFLSELSALAPQGRRDDATTSPSKNDTHTIVFTDMASSTSLTQGLGDAGAQVVRRTHNDIVRSALAANAGSEIKHTGDGIMASFSAASSALSAAIAIQRGVAAHKQTNPDSPLAVYVGLNAGEPIAEDDDLFGTSINLAARICDHAEPGQILASNVVRELAAGKDFLFSDLGETELRGFEDPVRLYEVRWRE